MNIMFPRTTLAVALAAAGLAACSSYVRRDEFDTTVADLRATDARLDSQGQALAQQLQGLSQKYDAVVSTIRRSDGGDAGPRGIRVDTVAYFKSGQAILDESAKPLLDDFARAVNANHANAMITVEGFTDTAGPAEANRQLGLQRANAVRDYLVTQAGLHPAQVRAVSYGEAQNRQLVPGATGSDGRENRRVSLVIDYAGPQVDIETIEKRERHRELVGSTLRFSNPVQQVWK